MGAVEPAGARERLHPSQPPAGSTSEDSHGRSPTDESAWWIQLSREVPAPHRAENHVPGHTGAVWTACLDSRRGRLTMPASPPTPGWSTRGETRPSPSGERESAQLAQLRDRQRDTSLLQHPGYQIRPSRTGGRDRWEQEQIRFSEVVNLCLRCGLHQEARLQTAREASPKEPPSGLWAPPAPCLPCPHLLNSQNGSLYMLLRARCGERLGDTHRKQTREKAQTGAAAPISWKGEATNSQPGALGDQKTHKPKNPATRQVGGVELVCSYELWESFGIYRGKEGRWWLLPQMWKQQHETPRNMNNQGHVTSPKDSNNFPVSKS